MTVIENLGETIDRIANKFGDAVLHEEGRPMFRRPSRRMRVRGRYQGSPGGMTGDGVRWHLPTAAKKKKQKKSRSR